jgi:hypothetical protein
MQSVGHSQAGYCLGTSSLRESQSSFPAEAPTAGIQSACRDTTLLSGKVHIRFFAIQLKDTALTNVFLAELKKLADINNMNFFRCT